MNRPVTLLATLCLWTTAVAQYDPASPKAIWEDRSRHDTVRLDALRELIWNGPLFVEPDSALGLARMMHDSAQAMGSLRHMAAALNLQAIVNAMGGDHAAAIGLYERSLRLSREAGDVESQATALKNIGGSHFMMGQAYDGLSFMARALELKQGAGDRMEANILTSMALACTKMDDYAKAEVHARKALAIAEAIADSTEIQYAITALGDNHLRQGNADAALPYYERGLAIAEAARDQRRIGAALEGLSALHAERGDHARAIELGERALEIARASGERAGMEQCYLNLHDVNKRAGRTARALEMLEQYTVLHDEIRSDENKAALLQQKVAFDYQLKEALLQAEMDRKEAVAAQEIQRQKVVRYGFMGGALLLLAGGAAWFYSDRKRRQERFHREAAELQTQALRAQMNPHFIFNALNSINAYLQRNDADRASSFLARFAQVMRGVLENSREREVLLREDLDTLRGYIELERRRLEEKFDLTISVDERVDPDAVMVPPLVVQPFVENAIWHGIAHKEGRGHLSIGVTVQDDHLIWTIEDDGVGRAAHTPDDAAQKRKSLGTAITRHRLELLRQQYGGRVGFRYEEVAQGTRVVVDMPLIQA